MVISFSARCLMFGSAAWAKCVSQLSNGEYTFRVQLGAVCGAQATKVRIPTMPIADSDLMAITIPSDADHRRSEATLGCPYNAGVIGIRQSFCC